MAAALRSKKNKMSNWHQAEQDWLREPEPIDLDEEQRKDAERGDAKLDLQDGDV